jgi:uncharacterized protein (DUF433 family)
MGRWVRTVKREVDDRLLLWLEARRKGITPEKIGAIYGVTHTTVRSPTNNVLEADLAESGEPPEEVLKHYWRQA